MALLITHVVPTVRTFLFDFRGIISLHSIKIHPFDIILEKKSLHNLTKKIHFT